MGIILRMQAASSTVKLNTLMHKGWFRQRREVQNFDIRDHVKCRIAIMKPSLT